MHAICYSRLNWQNFLIREQILQNTWYFQRHLVFDKFLQMGYYHIKHELKSDLNRLKILASYPGYFVFKIHHHILYSIPFYKNEH